MDTGWKYARQGATVALIIIGLMWVVFLLQMAFGLDLHYFALLPRTIEGLPGIFTTPLLHGGWTHIVSNSLSLVVLLVGMWIIYPKASPYVLIMVWPLTGLLSWIIARDSYHVGISGVIFAVASFLFFSGVFRKNIGAVAVSLAIAMFQTSLFTGIFPQPDTHISWESHLAGFIIGIIVAFAFRRYTEKEATLEEKKYSWETNPEHEDQLENVRFWDYQKEEIPPREWEKKAEQPHSDPPEA